MSMLKIPNIYIVTVNIFNECMISNDFYPHTLRWQSNAQSGQILDPPLPDAFDHKQFIHIHYLQSV